MYSTGGTAGEKSSAASAMPRRARPELERQAKSVTISVNYLIIRLLIPVHPPLG